MHLSIDLFLRKDAIGLNAQVPSRAALQLASLADPRRVSPVLDRHTTRAKIASKATLLRRGCGHASGHTLNFDLCVAMRIFWRQRSGQIKNISLGINSLVPLAGIEPALLAELDFESSAST